MSPTVLNVDGFRFYFFSREEPRIHVHVQSARGEAKIWIEPVVELAVDHGLGRTNITKALKLARTHEDSIREAWRKHFGS